MFVSCRVVTMCHPQKKTRLLDESFISSLGFSDQSASWKAAFTAS